MNADQARALAASVQARETTPENDRDRLHRELIEYVSDTARIGSLGCVSSFDADRIAADDFNVVVKRLRDDGFDVEHDFAADIGWRISIGWQSEADKQFERDVEAAGKSRDVLRAVVDVKHRIARGEREVAVPASGTAAEVEAFRRALDRDGFNVSPAEGEDGVYSVVSHAENTRFKEHCLESDRSRRPARHHR
jgi:hypothetical protein